MIYLLDFESNGLTYGDIEVTQCAYLKLDKDLNVIKEFDKYYFAKNIKDSDKITGLTYEKLSVLSEGKEFGKEELKELEKEMSHAVIIGQNVNYDILVIDSLCIKHDMELFPKYPLDVINFYSPENTLLNLSKIVKNNITEEGKRLLKEKFPNKEQYHNALYDIYSLYAVIKFDQKFKERLNRYLKDLPMRGDY